MTRDFVIDRRAAGELLSTLLVHTWTLNHSLVIEMARHIPVNLSHLQLWRPGCAAVHSMRATWREQAALAPGDRLYRWSS